MAALSAKKFKRPNTENTETATQRARRKQPGDVLASALHADAGLGSVQKKGAPKNQSALWSC